MLLHLVENSLIDNEELKIKSIIDDMNLIKGTSTFNFTGPFRSFRDKSSANWFQVKQTFKKIGCDLFIRH